MRHTVLIVEDEKLIREEIRLTTPWERFGCEVIAVAENGLEGEQLIRSLAPDIVITDIRMPGQDGIAMLERAMPRAAIILSGYSDFAYAKQAIRLGVQDYILKPVDDEEFYASLKKITQLLKQQKTAHPRFSEYVRRLEGDKQDFYVEQAVTYIKEQYASDVSLGEIAESIGITESYLSRLFKQKTGYSYVEYLRNTRLHRAMEMLQDQSRRVNEIAYQTGFRDMSYFSSIFKKHFGILPSQYQNGEQPPEGISDKVIK